MQRHRKRVGNRGFGIYAAQLNEFGPVKIDFSKDVHMRVKRIQADCPSGIVRLLGVWPISETDSQARLEVMRNALKQYEHEYGLHWYKPAPQLLEFIAKWSK